MDLLHQCQLWHEHDEYQKIIDALEEIPAQARTPEMDSELARAYNNVAQPGEKELFQKAIALLKPHEDYFEHDHYWNFRMAYAYYYLDQEGLALCYFQKALQARPGDRDALEFIENCRKCLALPYFEETFRQRTARAWRAFEQEEGEVRRALEEDGAQIWREELTARCEILLRQAIADLSLELDYDGKRCKLLLNTDGDRVKLFELDYFQRHAPASVLKRWDILVDCGSCSGGVQEELDRYTAYRGEEDQDPDADWRMDMIVGSTCCPPLIEDYLHGESQGMDELHRNGAVAGFLCYPLDGFTGQDPTQQLFDFRDALEAALKRRAGKEAFTLIGGGAGTRYGYVDLIAWDLPAVLNAAAEFFQGTQLPWASFHVFRREVASVRLLGREEEPEEDAQVHPETGSILSREDLDTLESFVGETKGYYGRMLDYLQKFVEEGVQEERFTEGQARRDLVLGLWYAYACLNLDEYEFYYRAAQWMSYSEDKAKGCGVWYYRYSVALMYCGRLEEARRYAELGVEEEPAYPWIWLQAGKLRSWAGDREGALEAVRQGLALEPGDHEFLTLEREIREGATLEQMEYHWINPELDQRLQKGLDQDADSKQRAISCITVNPAGLADFQRIFHPDPESFTKDAPYCSFFYPVQGEEVELVFRMNEAGLSKLKAGWLQTQKERLECGDWLTWTTQQGDRGTLDAVLFDLDYQVSLVYKVKGEEDWYFRVRLNEDGTPCETEMPQGEAEYYSEGELDAVQQHIEQTFGPFEQVWHELVSLDIHVDICMIPPTEERDYYTLVTMGMGAHRMHVPEELAEHKLERAELVIALPPDWKLSSDELSDETWYWPMRLLKILARLPIQSDTWLGWGHTMDNQEPFAPNTQLCGAMLIGPQRVEEGGEVCLLPDGDEVNFYQVIPLYREELEYKQATDADALLERLEGSSFVVHPNRPNVAPSHAGERAEENELVLDDGNRHMEKSKEKGLPVEELAGLNHLAIFLRWCMEHDLMSLTFLERYDSVAQRFQADLSHLDLRPFIRDELDGQLFFPLFDEEGAAFARWYYADEEKDPCYTGDIDEHALAYFGPERYHSGEFQDEAYLFVPFDEDYYQAMAEVIQRRWDQWQQLREDA